MRLAVISDIHANLEAFEAVLDDLDTQAADRVVSLGDNIGYGANPQEVMDLIRQRGIPSVMGNHESGLSDPALLKWFNPQAREVLKKTARLLNASTYDYIKSLPDYIVLNGVRMVHGCPPDSVTAYLFEQLDPELLERMDKTPEPLSFVGHTHRLQHILRKGNKINRQKLARGVTRLSLEHTHIINAGSVGQPRGDDSHAKYLILDREHNQIEVRFVKYDIETAAEKIRNRGFPEYYAKRLGRPTWETA